MSAINRTAAVTDKPRAALLASGQGARSSPIREAGAPSRGARPAAGCGHRRPAWRQRARQAGRRRGAAAAREPRAGRPPRGASAVRTRPPTATARASASSTRPRALTGMRSPDVCASCALLRSNSTFGLRARKSARVRRPRDGRLPSEAGAMMPGGRDEGVATVSTVFIKKGWWSRCWYKPLFARRYSPS